MYKRFKLSKYTVLSDSDQRIVCGCVYEPNVVDTDGAWASAETIEEACHTFNLEKRNVGVMHNEICNDIHLLESYIAPCELNLNGHIYKKGTWVITVRVDNDDLWADVKKGNFNGFSMGGSAEFGE